MTDTHEKQAYSTEAPQNAIYYSREEEVTLLDMWAVLVEYKKYILTISAFSITIALAIALLSTPIFKSTTFLAPALKDRGNKISALASGDLLAKNGDILVIPKKTQSVTVLGEVHYPTSPIYKASFARDDYMSRSGGATYKADTDRIYVVRANGEVIANNDSFWNFDDASVEIKPGDTIIVPLDASHIETLTLWTSATQIMYQIGVAVAAFNSAGIF